MSNTTGITIIEPRWPASDRVAAGITTRAGGHSTGSYASLNLAMHVGDDATVVQGNRRALYESVEPGVKFRWLQQVHGPLAVEASKSGADQQAEADALFTLQQQVACCVLTADCLPIFVCDEAASKVAIIHAGWRGLAAGIVQNTVSALQQNSVGKKQTLLAWLGPAIGPDHFEVGEEVKTAFMADSPDPQATASAFEPRQNKYLADIYQLATIALRASGITQVYGGGFCTVCDHRFYSYRRDGVTGRMASFIYLRD